MQIFPWVSWIILAVAWVGMPLVHTYDILFHVIDWHEPCWCSSGSGVQSNLSSVPPIETYVAAAVLDTPMLVPSHALLAPFSAALAAFAVASVVLQVLHSSTDSDLLWPVIMLIWLRHHSLFICNADGRKWGLHSHQCWVLSVGLLGLLPAVLFDYSLEDFPFMLV